MELNEQDISLIDQYLAGELAGDQLAAFRKRMETDASFAAEVTLQADVIAALRSDGRAKQKTQLAALQVAMLAAGEIKPYTPSEGGGGSGKGGGSAGGSFLRWLLGLAITGAVGYGIWYYLSHRNGEDGGSIMNIFQQGPTDTIIRRDTIRGMESVSFTSPGESHKDGGGLGTARPSAETQVGPTDVTVITQRDTQYVDDGGKPIEKPFENTAQEEKPPIIKGPTGKIVKEEGGKVPQHD